MKNIITIAKKELRAYFNNPTAYIVVLAFLLLWEFIFFRNVFLIGEVSLSSLFDFLPWIFMIVVPALTMGSLAEEKSEGTLEFLLTHPMSQAELVVGKFLGITAFLAMALLFVFPLAWIFNHFGNLDWGKVFSQYLAGLFLTMVLVSLGVCISSFFASLISAFLLSLVANFFLIIVGTEFFSNHFPLSLSQFLEQLSVSNHFGAMARGVVDTRDVWYFISLTAVFLGLTYLNLIKSKFGNRKAFYKDYQLAFVLLVGVVILSNIVGTRIPGRWDLTEEKMYTLSPATKEIAENLPDIVNIALYASDKLPAQFQPILRETKDILEDYRRASNGKIQVAYKNPSTDSAAGKEAAAHGIQSVRFNVVSQEEFQVKEGYLGIALSFGGKDEAIPFVQNINDLEYQLSSLINKLTIENKTKIGFVSGHGEKSLYQDYRMIYAELQKQFDVVDVAATGGEAATEPKKPAAKEAPVAAAKKLVIPEGVKTLVIASPTEEYSAEEKKTLADFMAEGGNVLFLMDGVTIAPQTMAASASQNSLLAFIQEQTGVTVKTDLVYDLRANEAVRFGGGQGGFILPYPFWVRAAKVEGNSPITAKLENVTVPWASSLELDQAKLSEKGWTAAELFTTSAFAGAQTASFDITPEQKLSTQDLGKKLLAVALSPATDKGGRVVVVGDADFMSDSNVQNSANNFGFGMESISWLSQEGALGQIKVKNMDSRKFVFTEESDPTLIKYGNMAFAFLLTAGYGSWRLMRRKKMKEQVYQD